MINDLTKEINDMWPLGSYDRMVNEIKWRENEDIPITFGILIVDYRQQVNREYILNYINRFNYKSDRYINFYLPGYLEEDSLGNGEKIIIDNKKYYFNESVYEEFLIKLENDFSIEYPYTPVLLLIEYNKGHFSKSNKVIIKLDDNTTNIKKTGDLFEKVFSIAKREVRLNNISNSLKKIELKSCMLDSIIKGLDNKFISIVYNVDKGVRKYKIF